MCLLCQRSTLLKKGFRVSQHKVLLPTKPGQTVLRVFLMIAAGLVVAVLVWQGITASGAPDPTVPHLSVGAAIVDTRVLVLREGLECILVLSAITASTMGGHRGYRRPIALGAGIGFAACLVTWFLVVGIVSALSHNLPALDAQAATGLLAVIVLIVIMNWFFHKMYWTGWISMHNRRKRALLSQKGAATVSSSRLLSGADPAWVCLRVS
jgi:high-affinity iron transporter